MLASKVNNREQIKNTIRTFLIEHEFDFDEWWTLDFDTDIEVDDITDLNPMQLSTLMADYVYAEADRLALHIGHMLGINTHPQNDSEDKAFSRIYSITKTVLYEEIEKHIPELEYERL